MNKYNGSVYDVDNGIIEIAPKNFTVPFTGPKGHNNVSCNLLSLVIKKSLYDYTFCVNMFYNIRDTEEFLNPNNDIDYTELLKGTFAPKGTLLRKTLFQMMLGVITFQTAYDIVLEAMKTDWHTFCNEVVEPNDSYI